MIIERDMTEIENAKNAKTLKVLQAAKGELLAFMLGARPTAETSKVVDRLSAIIEKLT